MYSIRTISEIIGAEAMLESEHARIAYLLTDSRRAAFPGRSLFFALRAARDGHDFIGEAWARGVRNFVIDRKGFRTQDFPGSNFLRVKDSLEALQQLAASHREQFDYPMIGITGSNGKTMVKEWLFQLLSPDRNIIRSPKSYNSQTGVPLSLWAMGKEYELGIMEAGISRPGEMERLEKMIRPDIGILTNIGSAHDEGFKSRQQKIAEKLKLFSRTYLLIYERESLEDYQGSLPGEQHFTWGRSGEVDLFVGRIEKSGGESTVHGIYREQELSITLPFTDEASIHNGITCWCLLLWMDYDQEEIRRRMRLLSPVSMRLELKQGINRSSLINDTYNSDLGSLEIALDFLQRQQQHPRKTVILSDVLQSGLSEEELYRKVADLLGAAGVSRLVGIGEAISEAEALFAAIPQRSFYPDTESFLSAFRPEMFGEEAILVKGARPFYFERIGRLLEQKVHETVLEINLNAMIHNLNFFKSRLKPGTGIMAMVKAFAYGSGSYEIASMLEYHKVDYLAVAYADEGVELRQKGIRMPIMVMNPEAASFRLMVDWGLEPELYGQRILEEFLHFLRQEGIAHYPVHLKLDTGMHRLGFAENEIETLVALLKDQEQLQPRSVFSHLAASEAPEEETFSREQIKRFEMLSEQLEAALGYRLIRHILNSAGILRFPEAQYEMVRLGIGLYGIAPGEAGTVLQTVGTLKTSISQIRELGPGETVGYGRAGKILRPSRIATVKIGYADGIDRRLGKGKGEMLVNGKRAPIIGQVCMDMCMLDVTGIDCREKDEVIIFNEELRIEEIAAKLETSPYELLTAISQRVKRIYTYE